MNKWTLFSKKRMKKRVGKEYRGEENMGRSSEERDGRQKKWK